VSDFTAKRLHIIAQGFSPGSVSWKGTLKVAPDVGARDAAEVPRSEPPSVATFRAISLVALPRAEALGYGV